MSFFKKIDNFRRKSMRKITGGVGNSSSGEIKKIQRNKVKRVLISRPNHRLGNQLLMMPIVQEVENTFPGCEIDLFTKGGLAPILFRGYNSVNRLIRLPKKHFKQLPQYIYSWFRLKNKRYDLVINVTSGSSSGRLSTKISRAPHKFFGEIEEKNISKYPNYDHIAKKPVFGLRDYLEARGIPQEKRPVPQMDLKLSGEELKKGKEILDKHVDSSRKTISIYTFATGDKCYSKEWWAELYGKLKTQFKEYNILEVLPVENVSQIDFDAPSYYNKGGIREIAAVIANTEVFVGADCGIMHLAVSSLAPTLGLFSRKNMDKYKPYGGLNDGLNTNEMTSDDIIQKVDEVLKAKK